jgi:hypothetical protein
MRGVMERNTMRYYLAIEAYLGALGFPPGERPDRMVEQWFAAAERYPRQLHELEHDEYVAMKVGEYERMHAMWSAAPAVGSRTISPAPQKAFSSPSPS